MAFDEQLKVEERVLLVDLEDAARNLAGVYPHCLPNAQRVERVQLVLGVAHHCIRPELNEEAFDLGVFLADERLELSISQFAEDFEEEDELIGEGDLGCFGGLLEG